MGTVLNIGNCTEPLELYQTLETVLYQTLKTTERLHCGKRLSRTWDFAKETCRVNQSSVTSGCTRRLMNDCDDDDDDNVMMMMMMMMMIMMMMMTMLQNKALDIPLHTSCLSATQPLERELPHGTQLFEAVPADQPAEDALHRPLVHTSAYKQTSGEAIYVDDMPLLEGQTPSAVTPRSPIPPPPPPSSWY